MATDFSTWGSADGLIQAGYKSCESWKQWLDEKCTAAVCEMADQFAGMMGALFGACGSGASNMLAKVDNMSVKAQGTPAPTVGELKKQPQLPEPSVSPELAQMAQKAFPEKFNFVDMDKGEGCNFNFAPSATPCLTYGQSYSMGV